MGFFPILLWQREYSGEHYVRKSEKACSKTHNILRMDALPVQVPLSSASSPRSFLSWKEHFIAEKMK